MPGVLIIESMAQTAAVLVVETLGPDAAGKLVYFMSIEGAKFRRPVVPGDQLRIHIVKERSRGNVWKFHRDRQGRWGGRRRSNLFRDDHGPAPRPDALATHPCLSNAKMSSETECYSGGAGNIGQQ